VPDPALAAALLRWLVPADQDPWRALVDGSVTVTSATTGSGARLRVVHNWSWDPLGVELPTAVRDVLGNADLDAGARLDLGPWDVRVLVEG
jgi:beta-galactosidase